MQSTSQIGRRHRLPPPGLPAEQAEYAPLAPTNSFADASAPILLKDSDLSGVTLTLTEIPLIKPPPGTPEFVIDQD